MNIRVPLRSDVGHAGAMNPASKPTIRPESSAHSASLRDAQSSAHSASLRDAHVAFELDRWRGQGLADTIIEEVNAAFEWLASVTVADLAPAPTTAAAFAEALCSLPVTEAAAENIAEVLIVARGAASDSGITLGEVATWADAEPLIDTVAGLSELRAELLDAITSSTAYPRLVAHVLYHGVKSYVLAENLFARKIPGALSLVKLGQRGLNTAVPGLEKAVDAQLSGFVQANIGETLGASRRYLQEILDPAMTRTLAQEAWGAMSSRGLAELTDALTDDDLVAVALDLVPLVRGALHSPALTAAVRDSVQALLTEYAEVSPADLLSDFGVSPQLVADSLLALAAPVIEQPAMVGFIESRLQARLGAFYDSI